MKSPAQQNGQRWVGDKIYMGHSQGAYGAERAALARDLETDARRQTTPERVTIFTDAQAAVKRMASEEPNPDRCMQHRPRGTLRRFGGHDRTSPLSSDGAQLTRAPPQTKPLESGPSS